MAFEMGATPAEAANANGAMFAHGAVKFCPHRSNFLCCAGSRSLAAHAGCGGGSSGGLTSAGSGHS